MRRHRVTLSCEALVNASWLVRQERITHEVMANVERGDERRRLRSYVELLERVERELIEARDRALGEETR